MQNFRNLRVWQKAHQVTLKAYAVSATFNRPAYFTLRDQLIRSAASMPANLAEGCGRSGDRDLRRFVRIALGSASELEYHLLLARDLGLLPDQTHEELTAAVVEVKRMLTGFAARLTEKIKSDDQAHRRD